MDEQVRLGEVGRRGAHCAVTESAALRCDTVRYQVIRRWLKQNPRLRAKKRKEAIAGRMLHISEPTGHRRLKNRIRYKEGTLPQTGTITTKQKF